MIAITKVLLEVGDKIHPDAIKMMLSSPQGKKAVKELAEKNSAENAPPAVINGVSGQPRIAQPNIGPGINYVPLATPAPQMAANIAPQVPPTPMSTPTVTNQIAPQAAAQGQVQRVVKKVRQVAPQGPAGVPRATRKVVNATTQTQPVAPAIPTPAQPMPPTNPVVQDLTNKVKTGVGTEEGYQNAVRLSAARRAISSQPVAQPAPIAPVQTVVHQVPIQPVPVQHVVQPIQTVDNMSGTEAAGVALKKGAKATGEAAGDVGKKAMELAGEHPAVAGAAGALGAAAGLRRILRGGNKPRD